MEDHPIIKAIIMVMLVLIISALGSAMYSLMRGSPNNDKTVKALTVRVGLSIALVLFLLILSALGIIEPNR